MRNFRDRYHSVWWCSLVQFTIYFSSVVVLSFGEVCEGGNPKLNTFMSHNTSHSDHSLINYAFVIFRLIHNEEHVTSVCKCVLLFLVLVFSVRCTECSFYPHSSIGAFWHILPVLFFCHCNYHPHRSICEAHELLRAGDFKCVSSNPMPALNF